MGPIHLILVLVMMLFRFLFVLLLLLPLQLLDIGLIVLDRRVLSKHIIVVLRQVDVVLVEPFDRQLVLLGNYVVVEGLELLGQLLPLLVGRLH